MPEHLAIMRGLGGDNGAGLRHKGGQVGRRPRRNEQRQYHAGKRSVEATRVDKRPQRDAQQDVRREKVNSRPAQQRQRNDRGRQGSRMDIAGVEHSDDHDRTDVVNDGRRGEEDA